MIALNLLVKSSYLASSTEKLEGTQEAQYKLFYMVGLLSKYIVNDGKKGCCKDSALWCMRVNKLVNKMVKEGTQGEEEEQGETMDLESLSKMHKKNIKYAEKNMQAIREDIESAI